jgi:hypothetical protein
MVCQSNNSNGTCYIIATSTLFFAAVILMSSCLPVSKAMMVKDKEPSSSSSPLRQHQINNVNLNSYAVKNNSSINDIVLLTNRSALNNNKEKQISGIAYTAKFECGVISEDEGLLTAGYYDTDISIFNKQVYPITVLLNVIVNNGNSPFHSIIKTLQPQKSTGISCKDIVNIFNIKAKEELVEGFMTIFVQLDNGILGLSNSGAINVTPLLQSPSSLDPINLLDVRLLYSANSFAVSPPQNHMVVDKISFSILNDTSGKIPRSMLLKTLYVTLQSLANTIFDPETQVKRILADKYNLSSSELINLKVKIYNINTAATTILDRHAISSLHIQPQAIYQ